MEQEESHQGFNVTIMIIICFKCYDSFTCWTFKVLISSLINDRSSICWSVEELQQEGPSCCDGRGYGRGYGRNSCVLFASYL